MSFSIGRHPIADGARLFVIAEIGLNHGGSLDRALALVSAAAAAGAQAVKLQTIDAARLVSPACPPPAHVAAASLVEFFRQFELDEAAHRAVADLAHGLGMALLASPFSLEAVDMLERVGVDGYKIASGDLTYDDLIRRCARTRKPLVLSTGMATLAETAGAISQASSAGAADLAVLHCVSAYPVPSGSENLAAVDTLRRAFDRPVGLSDHGRNPWDVAIAVAFGASLYERHLVLDHDAAAVDREVSSTPGELADAIEMAEKARRSLGSGNIECGAAEAPNLVASRRSLHATRSLEAGRIVTLDDIAVLRPATGLPPDRLWDLVGMRLTRDVTAGAPFLERDLRMEQHRAA